MRTLYGLVLASGLFVGLASQADAQLNINVGNPLNGQAFSVTTPGIGGYSTFGGVGTGFGGYSSGYSSYNGIGLGGISNSYSGYANSGYLAGPGVIGGTYGYPGVRSYGYNSGYSGFGAGNPYGYQNRPYYGAYGYGNYSNGSIDGLRPFRPFNRFRRY